MGWAETAERVGGTAGKGAIGAGAAAGTEGFLRGRLDLEMWSVGVSRCKEETYLSAAPRLPLLSLPMRLFPIVASLLVFTDRTATRDTSELSAPGVPKRLRDCLWRCTERADDLMADTGDADMPREERRRRIRGLSAV